MSSSAAAEGPRRDYTLSTNSATSSITNRFAMNSYHFPSRKSRCGAAEMSAEALTATEPSTSESPNVDALLQLESVGITDLYEYSLQKASHTCGIEDESVYRCRLCTRFDNCVVRGKKMLCSKASRLHYAAHMLTYKALLRFESPEVLCPVCDTLIFTAGSGEPLIELELINHIESEHAEVVLDQLSPPTLSPVQCEMLFFGVSSDAVETSKRERLRRKNYAYCLICGCDIFSRYRVPQAQHYFDWILEDHIVSHISNVVDPKPDVTYNCRICTSKAQSSPFKGAVAFLQHLFSYHRKKIDLACINNNTEHLWSAYNNLYIRIFGALAPLAYRLIHGGTLNPFDSPLTALKEEEEKNTTCLYPFHRKSGIPQKKKALVVEPVKKMKCCREECNHKAIEEEDVAMVEHVILHMKHDEYRMKHNKEGTIPVWCCPQADKIFTVGEMLIHFVSVHFYDNEMVEMPLFTFVLTRCKDILQTVIKSCFGDCSLSPFKVMAILIDMNIEGIQLPGWIRVLKRSAVNETFVELWSNVMCSRNLDAEDSDQICFVMPFSSKSNSNDGDNDEIMWIDPSGAEVKKDPEREISEWDSDQESDCDESEDSLPQKCEVTPMLEVIVSVRRCRYELREKLPYKESLHYEPRNRKRRQSPKRMPERIVVELREGRAIDPFNLFAHESEPSTDQDHRTTSESNDEPIIKRVTPQITRWTPRQLRDDFQPGEGTVMLTNSSPTHSTGIAIGQMAPHNMPKTRKGRPRAAYASMKPLHQRKLSDHEATKKLNSALESFITDTVNTIMPEEARDSFDIECLAPLVDLDREPSPPKKTLHELIMEQIEKQTDEQFPETTPAAENPPEMVTVPLVDLSQDEIVVPVKRGRGRPRKSENPASTNCSPYPVVSVKPDVPEKRGRGRPRKIKSVSLTVL